VAYECGWDAAEWQFKFSNLLSGTIAKVMGVAHHRDKEKVLYVHDAQKARLGRYLHAGSYPSLSVDATPPPDFYSM